MRSMRVNMRVSITIINFSIFECVKFLRGRHSASALEHGVNVLFYSDADFIALFHSAFSHTAAFRDPEHRPPSSPVLLQSPPLPTGAPRRRKTPGSNPGADTTNRGCISRCNNQPGQGGGAWRAAGLSRSRCEHARGRS